MPRGKPICVKCPRCKRGKYGGRHDCPFCGALLVECKPITNP